MNQAPLPHGGSSGSRTCWFSVLVVSNFRGSRQAFRRLSSPILRNPIGSYHSWCSLADASTRQSPLEDCCGSRGSSCNPLYHRSKPPHLQRSCTAHRNGHGQPARKAARADIGASLARCPRKLGPPLPCSWKLWSGDRGRCPRTSPRDNSGCCSLGRSTDLQRDHYRSSPRAG